METQPTESIQCPVPTDAVSSTSSVPRISMSHGGGGKLMHQLISHYIQPLYPDSLAVLHDSSVVSCHGSRLAMTTDSFVVNPIFFPGGDIGRLAVCGTVNDLAMSGAMPHYLSLAFIIEEGLPIECFKRILDSIQRTAKEAGVDIITGDTKVVERGKGDQIFITTSGVGFVKDHIHINPTKIQLGDVILVNGDIGRHGAAIMSCRDGTDAGIESDVQLLNYAIQRLIDQNIPVHCLRDLTRGGLASALNELAEASELSVLLNESEIPVDPAVASYCEILGLEPHYLANEGRFVCILPEADAAKALEVLGSGARRIGFFDKGRKGAVRLKSAWGTERLLPMLSGEQLPRIC
jgi:hydrogenase expression/formation protein HypE